MKLHPRSIPVVVVPLLSLTIVLSPGCGGGGGGGGGSISSPLAINTGNAPQVSAQSAQVSGAMGSSGSQSGGVTAAGLRPRASGINLAAVIGGQVPRFSAALGSGGSVAGMMVPQSVSVFNCTVSGTYSVSVNSSAASASITFSNCVDSNTSGTANGTMLLSSVSGTDPNVAPWSISAQIRLENFTVDKDSHVDVINGTSHMQASSQDGITETDVLSGASLALTHDSQGCTLSNFTMSLTENQNTLEYSTSLDGTLDSDVLGGHVTLHTITPFVGVNIDVNDPGSGSMKVTGANNSSVTLTATGSGNVQLDVDANGDGVVDADGTIATTWSALEAMSL